MIVTYINSDGTLKCDCVGGIDPKVVYGKRVRVGDNGITGVIAGTAVHNVPKDERSKTVPFDKLVIDIGCESREKPKSSSSRETACALFRISCASAAALSSARR